MTLYAFSAVGWTLSAIVFLIIWVAIAFWPARVARRKGHSFILYFIFSLIFFPLALLTAYLVRDRRAPAY
ncbi:MAG: hypothetical protein WCD11_07650 [Solirubrobacteraceae bacterium]|jgi:hypothetical protein